MKFVDDLFNFYKDQITGDDEDILDIVLSIMDEQDREDMDNFIKNLNDVEVYEMISFYLLELFRKKVIDEGYGREVVKEFPIDRNIH